VWIEESGQIPLSVFNSSAFAFQYPYLDGNHFTGRISDFQPTDWIALLPTWMGNKSFLQAIDLSCNHFEGPVPSDFCNFILLEYLDMSYNNLFGSLPSCLNRSSIKHAHLSKNQLSSPLTNAFSNSSSVVTLDLTYNNFMGSISNWIGNLSRLSVLL
jgi:Leucine-rich repeat (LRR) protein